jgi:hypothetical protein
MSRFCEALVCRGSLILHTFPQQMSITLIAYVAQYITYTAGEAALVGCIFHIVVLFVL